MKLPHLTKKQIKLSGVFIFILILLIAARWVLPYERSRAARTNYNTALIALEEGNLEQAEDYFRQAYKKEPENYNYLWQLAKTQVRLEKYEKAVESYAELISLIPDKSLPYVEQGEAYESLGNFERAEQLYSKGAEVDKNFIKAYLNWASLALRQDRRPEAKFILEEGRRNNPDSEELLRLLNSLSK